jgi:hypothetical protein
MAVITRYLQKKFSLQKKRDNPKKTGLVGVTFFGFLELMVKKLTKAAFQLKHSISIHRLVENKLNIRSNNFDRYTFFFLDLAL